MPRPTWDAASVALRLPTDEGVLFVQGEDRPGLVRAISTALAENGANIVSLDQHTDDPAHLAT